jgi:hypothetical protein
MGTCYGGTDVMERSCAMARGKDINRIVQVPVNYATGAPGDVAGAPSGRYGHARAV